MFEKFGWSVTNLELGMRVDIEWELGSRADQRRLKWSGNGENG